MILKVILVMAGTLKSAKIIFYYYQRLASKYYLLKMARPFAVGLLGWRDLAKMLAAQGLYNHATMAIDEDDYPPM